VIMAASNPSTPDLLKELLLKTRQTPFNELEEDLSCTICTQPFITADSPELPITLPCGHHFGSACILKWLSPTSERGNNSCPKCRAPIFDDWSAGDPQSEDENALDFANLTNDYRRDIDATQPGTRPRFEVNLAAIVEWQSLLSPGFLEARREEYQRGIEALEVGTQERHDAEQSGDMMLTLNPLPIDLMSQEVLSVLYEG